MRNILAILFGFSLLCASPQALSKPFTDKGLEVITVFLADGEVLIDAYGNMIKEISSTVQAGHQLAIMSAKGVLHTQFEISANVIGGAVYVVQVFINKSMTTAQLVTANSLNGVVDIASTVLHKTMDTTRSVANSAMTIMMYSTNTIANIAYTGAQIAGHSLVTLSKAVSYSAYYACALYSKAAVFAFRFIQRSLQLGYSLYRNYVELPVDIFEALSNVNLEYPRREVIADQVKQITQLEISLMQAMASVHKSKDKVPQSVTQAISKNLKSVRAVSNVLFYEVFTTDKSKIYQDAIESIFGPIYRKSKKFFRKLPLMYPVWML